CRSESRKVLVSYRPLASTLTAAFHDFCAFAGFFPGEFLAIALGQVVSSNMLTARSDAETEPSFFIVISPFRNPCPKLDPRRNLVSTITKPHGTRSAKASKISLRGVIAPLATYLIGGFNTRSGNASRVPK